MKVSVIIPVYNAEKYILQSIRSVLDQSYRDLEVIAIDDGSTDGSLSRLRHLAQRDKRVKVLSQPNQGIIATLNRALPLATGELIARMDADDISLPDRFTAQVEIFRNQPDLMLCGFPHHLMLEEGYVWAPHHPPRSYTPEQIRIISWFYAPFAHPSAMFRRALVDAHGLAYDCAYPHAEDFDLFRRVARDHPVHYLPRKLLVVRRTGPSTISRHFWRMQESHLTIVSENLRGAGLPADLDPLIAMTRSEAIPTTAALSPLADVLRALRDHRAAFGRDTGEAFDEGVANLVIRAMDIVRRRGGRARLSAFVTMADAWGHLRRRDRWLVRGLVPAWVPTVLHWFDRVRAKADSVPLHALLDESWTATGSAPGPMIGTVSPPART